MTDGEKVIWAATFALAYEKAMHPDPAVAGMLGTNGYISRNENYKREIAAGIESACDAVEAARESLKETLEGFGGDSNVYKMLAIMAKRR